MTFLLPWFPETMAIKINPVALYTDFTELLIVLVIRAGSKNEKIRSWLSRLSSNRDLTNRPVNIIRLILRRVIYVWQDKQRVWPKMQNDTEILLKMNSTSRILLWSLKQDADWILDGCSIDMICRHRILLLCFTRTQDQWKKVCTM